MALQRGNPLHAKGGIYPGEGLHAGVMTDIELGISLPVCRGRPSLSLPAPGYAYERQDAGLHLGHDFGVHARLGELDRALDPCLLRGRKRLPEAERDR
jgi:hypothetical protein